MIDIGISIAARERPITRSAVRADPASQIPSILGGLVRGLDRDARFDWSAHLRVDQLPPLDLGARGAAELSPTWAGFRPEQGGIGG